MGPVQVLVLGFDQPAFTGEIAAELARLGEAGVIRLVDALLVSRVDDTTFETLAVPDGVPADLGALTAALLAGPNDASRDEAGPGGAAPTAGSVWSLVDSVPVGGTAAVALIEHLWAVPLREAIQQAGGVPLDETWLATGDVQLLEDLVERHP
jgi:hypothetical protein